MAWAGRVLPFYQATPDGLRPIFVVVGWMLWWECVLHRFSKHGVLGGFVLSTAINTSLIYWIAGTIVHYSETPRGLAWGVVTLLGCYMAVYEGGIAWVGKALRNYNSGRTAAVMGTAWGGLVLKSQILSGFPWGDASTALVSWPFLVQSCALFGGFGLSALVITTTYVLHCPLWNKSRMALSWLFVWIPLIVYGFLTVHGLEQGFLKTPRMFVRMVQPNTPINLASELSYERFKRLIELSRLDTAKGVDLVVWPEGALPMTFTPGTIGWQEIQRLQKTNQAWLLVSTERWDFVGEDRPRVFNSALFIDENGNIDNYYDKVHLVPFGEYVPMRRILFFVDKLTGGFLDFSAGLEGYHKVRTPFANLGVLVCFESVFPAAARALYQAGVEAVIVLTNDAWFGKTSGAFQHLEHTRLRAVEIRRSVVFVANSGYSAVITPWGGIQTITPLFQERAVDVPVSLRSFTSFYGKLGSWLDWLGPLLFLAVSLKGRLKEHRKTGKKG